MLERKELWILVYGHEMGVICPLFFCAHVHASWLLVDMANLGMIREHGSVVFYLITGVVVAV